jgi:hypothetical protein
MFVYEVLINTIDKYCNLGESATMDIMKHFTIGIWVCFESMYLK